VWQDQAASTATPEAVKHAPSLQTAHPSPIKTRQHTTHLCDSTQQPCALPRAKIQLRPRTQTRGATKGGGSTVQSAQPTSEQPHSMQQLAAHHLYSTRLGAYVCRRYQPCMAWHRHPCTSSAPRACLHSYMRAVHQSGRRHLHTNGSNYTAPVHEHTLSLWHTHYRNKHSDANSAPGATLGVPCNTHTPTLILVTCHGHMLSSHPPCPD
jgi:hypothetical protein